MNILTKLRHRRCNQLQLRTSLRIYQSERIEQLLCLNKRNETFSIHSLRHLYRHLRSGAESFGVRSRRGGSHERERELSQQSTRAFRAAVNNGFSECVQATFPISRKNTDGRLPRFAEMSLRPVFTRTLVVSTTRPFLLYLRLPCGPTRVDRFSIAERSSPASYSTFTHVYSRCIIPSLHSNLEEKIPPLLVARARGETGPHQEATLNNHPSRSH